MDEQTTLLGENGSINQTKPQAYTIQDPVYRRNLFCVVHLGITFCLLFIAFNTLQAFETSVNKKLGEMSLATLYGVFSVSNLAAGPIVMKLGERVSLFIGGCGYVAFLGANLYPRTYTLIPGAAILGIGAAILWAAQGSYLAKNSDNNTLGFHSGVFFGLFMVNAVVGNLMAGFLLNSGKSIHFLFWVLFVIGAVATCLFLLLRKPHNCAEEATEKKGIDLTVILRFFKQPKMLLMISVLIYSGFSQSFFYGQFPKQMEKTKLGFIMAVFGASDVLGSMALGRLSDVVGRVPVLVFSTLCGFGGFAMCWFLEHDRLYLYFLTAVLLGMNDSGYNTQMYAVMGIFQPDNLEASYAFLKLFQASSSGIAFVYSLFLDFHPIIILVASAQAVAIVCFLIIAAFVADVNEKGKK